MNDYLPKVLTYLKQELPAPYRDCITIENDVFVIRLPYSDSSFTDAYEHLQSLISGSIQRVRVRQYDFEFKIWTALQERSFTILK